MYIIDQRFELISRVHSFPWKPLVSGGLWTIVKSFPFYRVVYPVNSKWNIGCLLNYGKLISQCCELDFRRDDMTTNNNNRLDVWKRHILLIESS